MVERDAIALARGYGLADTASGRPVDPAHTVFEFGSISKLFTCTASLQLAERVGPTTAHLAAAEASQAELSEILEEFGEKT